MSSEPAAVAAVAAALARPRPPRQRSSASVTLSQGSVSMGSSRRARPGAGPGYWWPRSASGNSVGWVDSAGDDTGGGGAGGGAKVRGAPRVDRRGAAFTGRRSPQDVVMGLSVLYCQAALLTLYVGLVRYEEHGLHRDRAVFQDVHVMIFIGFGFLMMFLRKYGYSAVGFTLLLGALMVQWAILCKGFFSMKDNKIMLSMKSLLEADVATAAVLISMGAVLGKTTPLQLIVMGVLEMVVFAANEHLAMSTLKAVDVGGSMTVHVFGAYFGLAVSRALGRPSSTSQERSSYTSDMFAMVGTVFLWLFWPSFNGALAEGDARHRAVINTYLALTSGCVVAYAVSSLSQRDAKFNMVHVQNATLAGGVAMGTAADLMVQPVGALVIGGLAGALSVLGYAFLQPAILDRLKIHDTCGVHNLHGMPGVMAGLVGAVMAAIASTNTYGNELYAQFPAMAPPQGSRLLDELKEDLRTNLDGGDGRTAPQQAGYQLAALAATLVISLVTGTITGIVIKQSKLLQQPTKVFEDDPLWEVPEEDVLPSTIPPSGSTKRANSASLEEANNIVTVSAHVESKQEL